MSGVLPGKAAGVAPAPAVLGVGAKVADVLASSPSNTRPAPPPTPDEPAGPIALVAKRTFSLAIRGATRTFESGAVIDDPLLMQDVLAARAPVESVQDEEDLLQCPHCRRFFTVALAVERED